MARKKKNTTTTPTVEAEVAESEPVDNNDDDNEEEEEEEEDEEDAIELLQVDVGDIMKVKQVLDEAVAGTFLDVIDLPEDHRLDNIKLAVMTLACIFAMVAQFSPIPFPESRWALGACCACYFALSGVLQLLVYFLDQDAIMTTLPLPAGDSRLRKSNPDMAKYGLRIRTNLPRFEEFFTVIVEFEGMENTPFVKQTWSVGKFFDVEGTFDEIGLMEKVEELHKRFVNGKFDKTESLETKKTK